MATIYWNAALFSAVLIMVSAAEPARGQDFPSKPLRIVTTTAGGGTDVVARLVAQGISPGLGQPVIVENRGSGVVPGDTVSKAAPDGYTLLVYSAAVWASQFFQKVPFDPIRDLAPVTLLSRSPSILAVHPTLPAKTVKQLIALAKANPGQIDYISGPSGSTGHLAAELFKAMAGVNMVRIAYSSNALEEADLLSGRVQLIFSSPQSIAAHIKSGKLRALASTGPQPSPLFPELPTIAASVPGYASVSILGMWAPSKTPDTVIKRINQEAVRFLNAPEVKQRFLGLGLETVGSSPEEFDAVIKADLSALSKLAREGVFK